MLDQSDSDHLHLACKIYYELNDASFDETMEKLAAVNPVKAELLKNDLARG